MNETRAARTIATYHVFECTRGVRHDVAIFYVDTGNIGRFQGDTLVMAAQSH